VGRPTRIPTRTGADPPRVPGVDSDADTDADTDTDSDADTDADLDCDLPPPPTHEGATSVPDLDGSKTHRNLQEAFAEASQANRRYLWFAQQADVDGHPGVAALLRSIAESRTGHALGHLDHLAEVGDPVSGLPVGDTVDNLESAIATETQGSETTSPSFAITAREEGFHEIADWFDTVARAERQHATRLQDGLESLS
jgi:rubrerythrin